MIELREPKYNVGDKMNFTNHPGIFEVVEMINFNFCINDYFYKVKHMDFGEIFITNEANLEPYVEKPNSVWNLKKGDKYYCLPEYCKISEFIWDDTPFEKRYRELGNAFLTKEEAEFELERRKIETEMMRLGGRRKIDKEKENWFIKYCFINDSLIFKFANVSFTQGTIYFDSIEKGQNAIETIGEDRIKKYIFVES